MAGKVASHRRFCEMAAKTLQHLATTYVQWYVQAGSLHNPPAPSSGGVQVLIRLLSRRRSYVALDFSCPLCLSHKPQSQVLTAAAQNTSFALPGKFGVVVLQLIRPQAIKTLKHCHQMYTPTHPPQLPLRKSHKTEVCLNPCEYRIPSWRRREGSTDVLDPTQGRQGETLRLIAGTLDFYSVSTRKATQELKCTTRDPRSCRPCCCRGTSRPPCFLRPWWSRWRRTRGRATRWQRRGGKSRIAERAHLPQNALLTAAALAPRRCIRSSPRMPTSSTCMQDGGRCTQPGNETSLNNSFMHLSDAGIRKLKFEPDIFLFFFVLRGLRCCFRFKRGWRCSYVPSSSLLRRSHQEHKDEHLGTKWTRIKV